MAYELSIHNVASIQVGDRKFHDSDSRPFWHREIVITDEKGLSFTISLFCGNEDDDKALKVQS